MPESDIWIVDIIALEWIIALLHVGNPSHPERPDWPEAGGYRGRNAPSTRSGGADGGRQRCKRARPQSAGARIRGPADRRSTRSAAPACERRRPPVTALVKLEVGLKLANEVSVRHRLRHIVPGGRSAGGANSNFHVAGIGFRNVRRGVDYLPPSLFTELMAVPGRHPPLASSLTTGRSRPLG